MVMVYYKHLKNHSVWLWLWAVRSEVSLWSFSHDKLLYKFVIKIKINEFLYNSLQHRNTQLKPTVHRTIWTSCPCYDDWRKCSCRAWCRCSRGWEADGTSEGWTTCYWLHLLSSSMAQAAAVLSTLCCQCSVWPKTTIRTGTMQQRKATQVWIHNSAKHRSTNCCCNLPSDLI